MNEGFAPSEIIRALLDEHVEFVVVGGIAVSVFVTDRATGDIDIIVPNGDEANRARLDRALKRLDARLVGSQAGHGRPPSPDDEYPTLMFATRHGRLDVMYRPDGSPPYDRLKGEAVSTKILDREVLVASPNHLIKMKLATGRRVDLDDVATLASRGGARRRRPQPLRVRASWRLPQGVEEEHAREALAGRVTEVDPGAQVWIEDGHMKMEAERDDLDPDHLRHWVHGLHDRLRALSLVGDEPEVAVS